jgi:arginyl-tRNA synthetase
MKSMLEYIAQIKASIKAVTGLSQAMVELTPHADFGDLTSNVALVQARNLKVDPWQLATEWSKKISKQDWIKSNQVKVEPVRPGFINFFLSKELLFTELIQAVTNVKYGSQSIGFGKTAVVEYSSPNTNKPLHLGHLRNDALGMSLANLLEFFGFKVIKTCVVNDRGVHIMKSLYAYQTWGKDSTPDKVNKKGDHFVGDYYVMFNNKSKAEPELTARPQALLKMWETGDSETRELLQKMNAWVYQGWESTYTRYGSKFDQKYYESDLYDKGKEIIKEALNKKLVQAKTDGSLVIDLSPYGLGGRDSGEKVLVRGDGTTVYISQDIYLAFKRYQDFSFEKMIYVVADEQNYHFQVLFKILEIFGYSWVKNCLHYSYGMVNLPSGKMKSREGTVVDADNLLDELSEQARQEISKRNPDFSTEEKQSVAEAVSTAAVKYWLLKSNSKSTVLFDPVASLDFEGDTGPYLLYSYVRLLNILRKTEAVLTPENNSIKETEILLIRKLSQWPVIVSRAYEQLQPHYIAEYLYELSGLANAYYQSVPILKAAAEERIIRLYTIKAVTNVLAIGLGLLNIKTINRM